MHRIALSFLLGSSLLASLAAAQPAPVDPAATPSAPTRSAPTALPIVPTVPEARDIAWTGGTIKLEVDATDIVRRIVQVEQTVPVAGAGPLTLLLPQWLPGNHAPRGTIDKLAGLTITAAGKDIGWQRDPFNVFAFHIAVPPGATNVVVRFQFLAPTAADQGRIVVTDSMMNLQWNSLALYPAGYYVRRIPIQASLKLPQGWTAATALRGTTSGGTTRYEETDFATLIDSPIFAGRYFRAIDLGQSVTLNIVADDPAEMMASPEQIATHKKLVDEAVALFGAKHFDHYDFLLAISDSLGGIGLEHHRSSENQVDPGYFTRWNDGPGGRNILPHEFAHSWDGKFRQPELLWTPDYATPMQDDLLWVYEGQDQFWGYVLGARSGIYSKEQTLDALASIAAKLDTTRGREWRPMGDTAYDPIIAARRPKAWTSWQRSEDYYNEGLMIWLEADAIIRRESRGAKGLDDFARAFFGMNDGDWGVVTYSRQDVVDALNAVQPYDWDGFLRDRVQRTNKEVTKGGFALGGYKLVFGETPNSTTRSSENSSKAVDQSYGVGLIIANTGDVRTVIWDSPAFKAGFTVGTKIIAVNGLEYSGEQFKRGLRDATDKSHPLSLIIKQDKRYRVITLDYSGGIRYPRLEKSGEGETSLDRLLQPRTTETQ